MAKLEYLEQTKKDKEFHDLVAADKAATKYKKHYEICFDIVLQITDFSSKVAEYRELTDDLIPPKLWRDWVNLFKSGQPLYPESKNKEIKRSIISRIPLKNHFPVASSFQCFLSFSLFLSFPR